MVFLMKSRILLGKVSRIDASFIRGSGVSHFAFNYIPATFYSTQEARNAHTDVAKEMAEASLAKSLANLMQDSLFDSTRMYGYDKGQGGMGFPAVDLASSTQESCHVDEVKLKPKTRLDAKRLLEMRVKKKVKEQCKDGMYQDLLMKVVADAAILKGAYDCIRVTSNVDLASEEDRICFQALAEDIAGGKFDVKENTYSIATRGSKVKKAELVLPNLKLRVVQEVIRIVLEVVYKPYFSKISHGLHCGRDHWSALKYIRKEISNPDWWFTLILKKKVDDCVLSKLLSSMEERVNDPDLCDMLRKMFHSGVLNLEFGGFAKGQGLPQEGLLSPILMSIYLDLFDREVYRLSMLYEISDCPDSEHDKSNSKLRDMFRRQINGITLPHAKRNPDVRIHCVRFMDEIFFAVSGPKEVAFSLKSDAQRYLNDSLYLDVDTQSEILACHDATGVKFLGTLVKRRLKERPAVLAVHKLKDKVKMFTEQKQEIWDEGSARIGMKWLAHGLKKVKESEIKHLADPNSVLHQVSIHRKPGMKTDHWYKELLKIWMQDVNARSSESEKMLVVKHIVEPALPRELTDAFYEFQKQARNYISSETASLLSLLPGSSKSQDPVSVTEILAPATCWSC